MLHSYFLLFLILILSSNNFVDGVFPNWKFWRSSRTTVQNIRNTNIPFTNLNTLPVTNTKFSPTISVDYFTFDAESLSNKMFPGLIDNSKAIRTLTILNEYKVSHSNLERLTLNVLLNDPSHANLNEAVSQELLDTYTKRINSAIETTSVNLDRIKAASNSARTSFGLIEDQATETIFELQGGAADLPVSPQKAREILAPSRKAKVNADLAFNTAIDGQNKFKILKATAERALSYGRAGNFEQMGLLTTITESTADSIGDLRKSADSYAAINQAGVSCSL
jgi:hypothetical protein